MVRLALACLLLASLALSGCLMRRVITHMEEHPSGAVMIVRTDDYYLYPPGVQTAERRYWRCTQTEEALECVPACGGAGGPACATDAVRH